MLHDAVDLEHRLIVLAGVRRSLIGVMEQAACGAAALHRHVEGLDGQMSIVDGADGPPHNEPREQIENDRAVPLPL